MKRPLLAGIAAAALALIGTGCGESERYHTLRGAVWNTSYTIKYKGSPTLADSISDIFRRVEMSLSPFNDNSLISKINRNEQADTDSLIEQVLEISQRVNHLSGKAFDPTLSPLINLWGFGYEKPDEGWCEPTDSAISEALTLVGIAECSIDGGKMTKKSPGTTFNFSAVTKGYGADLIGRMMSRNGVENYMIEIGGEIALKGYNDRGKPWRVMLEAPSDSYDGARHGLSTIELTDCGIATSGNYRNYRETGHGRVGHTISASTGWPVETSTLSASVIAPTCGLADALATAVMAMDTDSAMSMLDRIDGVRGVIITADTILTIGIEI